MTEHKDNILIVDDEPMNVKVLSSLLRPEHKTIVATNGQQALSRARGENRPDLILLDIILPDIDGFEVCRQLKEDEETKDIPIIFITSKTDVTNETKGFDIGAVDYITKPFHPSVVTARVKTHLNLKRKTDLLEKVSSLDGLLDIPNRRKFEEVLKTEWERALRNQSPLSLILGDIDSFKQYNDHYGHARGDECLKQVTREMARHCRRPADVLARYGGEEFAFILPDTDSRGAKALAEEIRNGIDELELEHVKSAVCSHVTISLGVGTMIPTHDETALALIQAADTMLYKAKEEGRNCVAGEELD